MVLGQILRQLEPSELVLGRNPPDHPCTLKVDEVPIRRAPRHLRKLGGDVRNAHRMAARGQQLDDRPPAGGIALVGTPEPHLDQLVQVVVHPLLRVAGLP